ncbi:MAG: hypothetical protein HY509_01430 [Acidobacteria bacterium]|nr:hypothetical protein [Acidobacteriota bacterium]
MNPGQFPHDLDPAQAGRIRRGGRPVPSAFPGLGVLAAALLCLGATVAGGPHLITARNGRSRLELPAGWRFRPYLNATADLQVADVQHKSFLIVLSEPKPAVNHLSLEAQSDIALATIVARMEGVEATSGPVEMMIGGHRALRYEFRGRIEGVKVAYIHTTIEGRETFHQIVAWTTPSRLKKNRAVIEAVIASFREVGP